MQISKTRSYWHCFEIKDKFWNIDFCETTFETDLSQIQFKI
jgi:hypothetical protein